jgi:hypothetical protein
MLAPDDDRGSGKRLANLVDVVADRRPLLRKHDRDADDIRGRIDRLDGSLLVEALGFAEAIRRDANVVGIGARAVDDLDPIARLLERGSQVDQTQRRAEGRAIGIPREIDRRLDESDDRGRLGMWVGELLEGISDIQSARRIGERTTLRWRVSEADERCRRGQWALAATPSRVRQQRWENRLAIVRDGKR